MKALESSNRAVLTLAACLLAVCLTFASFAAPQDQANADYANGTASQATQTGQVYKIIYKLNGGTQAAGQRTTIKEGKTVKVSKLKNPTRTYYKFMGWYANKKLTKPATKLKGTSAKSARRVYAKWKRTSYKIVYKLNGGTMPSGYKKTIKVKKTLDVAKLKTPTRNGYKFAGWYTDSSLKNKATQLKGASSQAKRRVYAKWTSKSYKITYILNGGAISGSYATKYKTSTGLASLPTPEQNGYSFIGWYTDANFTEPISAIPAETYGSLKLYAKWEKRYLVAHRGYHAEGAAKNSMAAFEWAADEKFTHVETDIRFTADDKPVLSHDAYASAYVKDPDTGEATGDEQKIYFDQLTLEQLQNDYVFDEPTGSMIQETTDEGTTVEKTQNIAEFDEFLDLCKQRNIIPHIELKEGTAEQIKSLTNEVDKKGMTNSVYWISFYPDLLEFVKVKHPSSNFVLLFSNSASTTKVSGVTSLTSAIATADSLGANGAHASLGLSKSLYKSSWKACREAFMPLGLWTLTDETAVSSYDQYVSEFTVDGLSADEVPSTI